MKRPPNRYDRGRVHNIKDVETVECPYCHKKMQFLHWMHLKKLHNKSIYDVRQEFPEIPTMTKKESSRRKIARKDCNNKIVKTCKQKYGGIGFASEGLAIKSRVVMKERYGNIQIMKTDHGKEYFAGELNPMKDPEISKKVSESMKGKPSKLKGKTYEEILGEEKAEVRRIQQIQAGVKGQTMTPKISAPQKELFKMVKKKYPTAVMEYPILDYCLDIAIPEMKLCYEYDGSYWHDIEKDKKRDKVLKKIGWKVIRFIDELPKKI